MAKKATTLYQCSECGYETVKWLGKCPSCGSWNSFKEIIPEPEKKGRGEKKGASVFSLSSVDLTDDIRYSTGMGELDRVLGGGLVKGSIVLIGGDPGIGKSTLLLQICEKLGKNRKILYVSGEESMRQIKLRADRLNVTTPSLFLYSGTDMDEVFVTAEQEAPDVLIVDSIQTMVLSALSSSAGSITQIRECTSVLLRLAKEKDITVVLVGHVNKEGNLAGPMVLEHMVDAVFQFEGDKSHSYRILRAVKNRYGATNEIAVFEMDHHGLKEVRNPSAMLLSERPENVSGSCVAALLEGSRPLLAEVQALVTKTGFPAPRRLSTGFDYNRMSVLLAVLEKRAGFFFGNLDVYVNVVGGFRLDEPAADLPVALAVVSGLLDRPTPSSLLAVGEIGLGGEIRSVIRLEERLKEGERLGFRRCIVPYSALDQLKAKKTMEVIGVKNVKEAIAVLGK